MELEDVINSIKNIQYGSCGSSLRRDKAACDLLIYLGENTKQDNRIAKLTKELNIYYKKHENRYTDGENKSIDLLPVLLNDCEKMLLAKKDHYSYDNDNVVFEKILENKNIEKYYVEFVNEMHMTMEFEHEVSSIILLSYSKKYIDKFDKKYKEIDGNFNSLNKKIDELTNNTNSLINSFITSLLGVSLESSIVACINKISGFKQNMEFILLVLLVIITTLGLSYIFANKFSKKSLIITLIMITYLIVFLIIFVVLNFLSIK